MLLAFTRLVNSCVISYMRLALYGRGLMSCIDHLLLREQRAFDALPKRFSDRYELFWRRSPDLKILKVTVRDRKSGLSAAYVDFEPQSDVYWLKQVDRADADGTFGRPMDQGLRRFYDHPASQKAQALAARS